MTTGTNIKDRCRLCYTRLKDISSLHHKIWCSQHHNRIYNIYKCRPFRYRDLIVRYLCINLPEDNLNDQYSNVICGGCASSLIKLDTAYQTFERTQKILQTKFRKTSQIIRYQIDKQIKQSSSSSSSSKLTIEQKTIEPKRLSKRKGAPKHINQTINHHKKPTSNVQLIFKIQSPNHNEDNNNNNNNELNESQNQLSTLPKRTSPRRKHDILTETTNQKKKFKCSTKDSKSSVKLTILCLF